MKVKWTKCSLDDIKTGKEYIEKENRNAAIQVVKKIKERVKILNEYPRSGRKGRENDTFELIVMNTPYLIVYEISDKIVFILRVLHHSQQWPSAHEDKSFLSFDW